MISLDQFYANHVGKGMDYDGAPAQDPIQCVDLPKFWLREGFDINPGAWGNAHEYFDGKGAAALRELGWQLIPNDPNNPRQVPPRGALVVWSASLPGSGGGGHIDICWSANPGALTFVGFDQNWGGKAAKLVTHNWSYVLGWLVPPEGGRGAGPAPQAQGDTIEMIANEEQAHQAYQMLRPNGDGSADEIAATAGKRTWANFANDARPEINQRNANLMAQAQHLVDLQNRINDTNNVVTQLRETITSSDKTNQEKQVALEAALAQIASDNAEMATLHDQVTDLQKQLKDPFGTASAAVSSTVELAKEKVGKSGGPITALFRFLLQLKFPKLKKNQ